MNKAQQAAFVFAQAVCALAEIEGMRAENTQRAIMQNSPAFVADDFDRVAATFHIDHNSVVALFGGL